MREIVNLNRKWAFVMDAEKPPKQADRSAYYVNLPHTWNAIDGQDGGGDYFRGTCAYLKTLSYEELPAGEKLYLELLGANSSADVYIGGEHLAHHDGGYSTWRVDVSEHISRTGDTPLCILVSNAPSDRVYPQMADFTFYGGLYRDVNLIGVPKSHFDLMHHGGPGISVHAAVKAKRAQVRICSWVACPREGQTLRYTICNTAGQTVAMGKTTVDQPETTMVLDDVHLWNGRKDPYLYTLTAELQEGDTVLDSVRTRFGCRTFAVDSEKGFILNGESYPLRGVSRHQDRWGIGNALLPQHHREDMALIAELGANTIRLAHYQHDQQFYDLCDEYGMVVWAEIPYISHHMKDGRENTIEQMKELIVQNVNHPSICFWGLSNEITMRGAEDPDLIENHRILNDLCHEMDPTRLTTLAAVSMCDIHAQYLKIPDVIGYNHYFGWYGGETDMNGPWLDDFHRQLPDIPIGVSEYGCEGLNWHSEQPIQGDYTEEYQAHYHEELIRQLFTRPYIWATYVWNMFDFGADNRAEGGEHGQNHKGLVTFDRTYKKDAFYAYKAWLSDTPFVHIAGKRFVDHAENPVRVTVYSNLPQVELFANGKSLGRKQAADHFFRFDVPSAGETKLEAIAGDCRDEGFIRRVDAPNEAYRLREKGTVLNWFDVQSREGHFSLHDKLGDILKSEQACACVQKLLGSMRSGEAAGFEMTQEMMKMMNGFTLLRLTSMMGTMGRKMTKEELLEMNEKLGEIRKEA